MKSNRMEYPNRLSVQITDAMDDRLNQVARARDEAKAEVVRAALRAFLDEQVDVIGSRKHFTKTFGKRIDQLERMQAVSLWLEFTILQLLYERIRRQQVDLSDLMMEAITGGVAMQDDMMKIIDIAAAHQKTKPPA